MKSLSRILPFLIWMSSSFTAASQDTAPKTVHINKGDIQAVFVDNSAYGNHRSGYNGISELYHTDQDSSIFVDQFAGLNLEHIFDGDSLEYFFEPRKEKMTIEQTSDSSVVLYQPTTPLSKVESWTTFTVVEPQYIDMEFKFIVHDKTFFNHDYLGIFWASYINSPKDINIYFKGKSKENKKEHWISARSPKHGVQATHLGEKDKASFFMAPNFNVTLANNFSDYTVSKPFYYGRFHNMVLAYFFSKPKKGTLRITQSPSGAGPGRPAWDFHYLLPNLKERKEYSFKIRTLYKEWLNAAEIEEEYQQWKKSNK